MKLLVSSLLLFALLTLSSGREQQRLISQDDSLNVPGDNPFVFCQDPKNYILDIDHIDISPNPPKAGTNLTIEASGYLSQKIKKNSTVLLELRIKVGGSSIPFIKQKQDLCDQLESVDEECPVKKGNLTFTRNVTLPEQIPKATYLVKADVFDQNEEEVTCVEASVAF